MHFSRIWPGLSLSLLFLNRVILVSPISPIPIDAKMFCILSVSASSLFVFSAGSGIPNIMRLFSFLVSSLFSFDAILDIALVASFGSFFQKSAEVFAVGLVIFASSCIIFWSFSLFSASNFSSLSLSCIVSASSSVALSSSFEILFFFDQEFGGVFVSINFCVYESINFTQGFWTRFGLIYKLIYLGVPVYIIRFIKNFLIERFFKLK